MRLLLLLALPLPVFAADVLHFSRDIRPILSENCFACHGPDEKKREAGLRLDEEVAAKKNNEGVTAIVPGHPEKSAIIERIETKDPDEVMPPPKLHKTVSAGQIALLKEWIKQGAKWGNHWSYETVQRPPVPGMKQQSKGNAVDAFIEKRLHAEGLDFSPAADASVLLRRVALDLTGLPPSLEEMNRFAGENTVPLEVVIQHYLGKPGYGEHWARMWLDLARYADSSGYPSDQPREIWAYRDWVIRAFNANMPFDQFTIEQLAGDLLPNPTEDQLIATAFHRNTMTQNEGGTSDEEFRTAAIIDRVNTTMAVWMGTSMACAQCHTHKYDPITNKEYFQFYAILNQSADADKKDESPLHEIWQPGQKDAKSKLAGEVAALDALFAKPDPVWLGGLNAWAGQAHPELAKVKPEPKAVIDALAVAKEKRSPQQVQQIRDYYVRNVAPEAGVQRRKLADARRKLEAIKPVTVPIMQDLKGKDRRVTRVQLRGNWQALDEEVQGGTPAAFPSMVQGAEANRLALAKWLVDRKNPLTARVMMNRLWEQLFGVGLVRTSEEFGSQGELPFHPDLLDWLAAEFMDSGWDVKHMLTVLVSSRSYRQSSKVTPDLLERDPENRLLARGPRFRPTGEMLRDQALALSGLLSPKMFGPAVRPVSPSLGLSTAFGRGNDWTTSDGEDRHRRSIYTEVRRNAPYASFMTFDATNREVCTLRRNRTNTPLQAFVTLNDPVFIECAQALARRTVLEGGSTTAQRLQWLFRLCLTRAAGPGEVERLTKLLDEAQAAFAGDPQRAVKMATDPLGPIPTGMNASELAAWTTVANVVTNLDEFVMRR